MSDKLKLIFIDIDGVVNNMNDGSSYFNYDPATYSLSQQNIDVLKHILKMTGAKLVLSTSWRKYDFNFKYKYRDMEFHSPLKKFIDMMGEDSFFEIRACPHLNKQMKFYDIIGFFYLLNDKKGIDMSDVKFAVLDDAKNQGLEQFKNSFFCISSDIGLVMSDARNIIHHLNVGECIYDDEK